MDKIKSFPIGDTVQMHQQHINPYPMFETMLEHEPVSWIREINMWHVTRRHDVLRIIADTDTFTVVSNQSLMRQRASPAEDIPLGFEFRSPRHLHLNIH